MAETGYVYYPIVGPYLDKSKPPVSLQAGSFADMIGVDGRFTGCARKFYGMKLVKDFDFYPSCPYTTVYRCLSAVVRKGETAYYLRGFVFVVASSISTCEVRFEYYDSELETWGSYTVWLATEGIFSTTAVDVASYDKYLYVAVAGKDTQVVYWNGTAVVGVDAGPGEFYQELPAPAYSSVANTGGYLTSNNSYAVAYRFYHSTRGLFSALSAVVNIDLPVVEEGTPAAVVDYKTQLATMTFPNGGAETWFDHTNAGAGFGELFDSVQIFRSIALSGVGAANMYLDSTIDMPAEGAWDATTFTVGVLTDEVLATQTRYDPFMDIMIQNPQGGAILYYNGSLFEGDSPTVYGGIRTKFSNPYHESLEYFTSEGMYKGNPIDGQLLRFLPAGDGMFIVNSGSLVLVKKQGGVVRFYRMHIGRGAVSAEAAHSAGNNILILTPMGFGSVDGQSGTLNIIGTLSRLVDIDWKSSLSGVSSAYDSRMGVSMFLNPTTDEIACVWHTSQVCTMLIGTNFVDCTQGLDPIGGEYQRAFFCDNRGRVVMPDVEETGAGNMHDLAVDNLPTSVYARVPKYYAKGASVGTWTTVVPSATTDVAGGDYVLSPVVFRVRAWPVPEVTDSNDKRTGVLGRFQRKIVTSLVLEVKSTDGFTGNNMDFWRVGVCRNNDVLPSGCVYSGATTENPADFVQRVNVDGLNLEPFVEQAANGVKFELTALELGVSIGTSRKITL